MNQTKPTYKQQGNVGLFDSDETMEMEAPRQHNTREENKIIKEDRGGELWNPEEGDTEEEKRRKANKKRQKDIDAR